MTPPARRRRRTNIATAARTRITNRMTSSASTFPLLPGVDRVEPWVWRFGCRLHDAELTGPLRSGGRERRELHDAVGEEERGDRQHGDAHGLPREAHGDATEEQ